MSPIITLHIYDSVSANEPYVYDHSNKLNVKAKIRLQTVSLTVQSRLLFSINLRLKLYVINFEIQLILKTLKPTVLPFLTPADTLLQGQEGYCNSITRSIR